MVDFVRKYVFKGSEKNTTAPHIFMILVGYVTLSTIYYVTQFSMDYILFRSMLNICMVLMYVFLERSNIKQDTLSFLTPASLMLWILIGVVYFGGDFLVYSYTLGGGMIALTYMKPRGIAIYTSINAVAQGILIFIVGMNLMGRNFSAFQDYAGFATMIILHVVLYVFCKKYTKAAQAKALFLSSMSHEIRTPLNAIIGMTTIGKSARELEQAQYTLRRIESASSHLLGVVNDILDMSKIDSGKFELSLKKFSFEQMLEHVHDMISFSAKDKEQLFSTTIDPDIPKFLYGDDQRLSQAIINVLGNAVKFTPRHGNISLKAKLLKIEDNICTLQILVQDTGIGISDEQQKSLFTIFNQANVDITRNYGGSGLGLAITKNIVEMMNGKIWVESEIDKGSIFTFTVQIQRGYSQDADTPEKESNTPNLEDHHILLVEDIEINREIMLTLLEPTGVKISCAENGEEAVRMFNASPEMYGMIFMDIQMPVMDGCEATRFMRALVHPRAKEIPIIAMTANVFREDIEYYLSIGMNGHVGKPINVNEIFNLMCDTLVTKKEGS
ncbi:MAG: ATP-binding protein [Defluviitaleaceae bacterium]|nr:ATP-binding protein [Defluviitaleaceae bacterium]